MSRGGDLFEDIQTTRKVQVAHRNESAIRRRRYSDELHLILELLAINAPLCHQCHLETANPSDAINWFQRLSMLW